MVLNFGGIMIIAIDIIKFIILVLTTFCVCQIITGNKKRLSVVGTFLIAVSTAVVQYINSGLVEALIFGQLFIICLENFLKNSNLKYFYIVGMPLSIVRIFFAFKC